MKTFLATGIVSGGMFLAALALGLAGSGAAEAQTAPEAASFARTAADGLKLNLFFMAKRRSQIEPCGCQTKQQGGVQYEASLYSAPNNYPDVRVDAGEWTRGRIDLAPVDSLKTSILLRALAAMRLDAVNLSLEDIQFTPEYFNNLRKEHPEAIEPLVSCNIFALDQPDRPFFAPYRIVTRKMADGTPFTIGITGATSVNLTVRDQLTELKTDHYLIKAPKPELEKVLTELRPQVDFLMVLFAGSQQETLDLAASYPAIDYLVTTSYLRQMDELMDREGLVYLLTSPSSLGKILGRLTIQREPNKRWLPIGIPNMLLVALDVPIDPDLLALVDEFKKRTAELAVDIPSTYGVKEVFAGATRCSVCHSAIYASWEKSKHAHAMQTLIDRNQQFNPECVQCHVTGFRQDNGFFSVQHRPSLEMMNVQCEVCHGPARRHVELEQMILAGVERWKSKEEYAEILKQSKLNLPPEDVKAQTCIQCHQGENDPNFVFEESIHKVDHSDVGKEDREMTPGKKPASF